MADKHPLRATFTAGSPTGLEEFQAGDTIGISHGGTGQTTASGAFTAISPLTTLGDILYHNGTKPVRLARGDNADVLTLVASVPSWQAAGAPGAHAASHEEGGADVVTVSGSMIGNGAIINRMLGASAVTATKIAASAILTANSKS